MRTSNALTTHLARAAGTIAVVPPPEEQADTAGDEDKDEGRCAASVISGQRCSRRAAEGNRLCKGHIAMGTEAPPLPRSARR